MDLGFMAAVGRWCFVRRWWVLAIWLVVLVGGAAASGPVFASLGDGINAEHVESVDANRQLSQDQTSGGQVTGVVDGVDGANAGVRDLIARAGTDLAAVESVQQVDTPRAGTPAVSADGRTLLIQVTLDAVKPAASSKAIDAVTTRLHRLQADLRSGGQSQAVVRVGGNAALNRETNRVVQADIRRAELTSMPITLLVLVVIFGGLLAAGVPVLAAVVSMTGAMLVLLGFSAVVDLDQSVVTVTTLLGLGLSIDYGLLLVARYREELAAGADPVTAVARTWATAGRTILFSAFTVIAALSGLLMFDVTRLRALGAAGISIALVAMLTALTLTAAVLGLLKGRVRPSRRAMARLAAGVEENRGFFQRLARLVQRRPWPVALITAALLLLVGLPLWHATVKLPQLENIPNSVEAKQAADLLTERFATAPRPAVRVIARMDAKTLQTWADGWRGDPSVNSVGTATKVGTSLSSVVFEVRGDPQGAPAQDLVHRLRDNRAAGGQSWVTGDAAVLVDMVGLIKRGLPAALLVMVVAMFLLLFAMTGSLVVPVKAILANVVSLGATFGVMVAVFQEGWASGPLGVLVVHGVDPFVLVVVFAFAFGLSMDYELFLLGRVKEYVDAGAESDAAVRLGLQRTGRVITSAALLMVIVFACFAAGRTGGVQQLGLGLTVAVLVDATIVRCLLVPATMTLLGRRNWWAPAPLRRLHERLGLGERVLPPLGAPAHRPRHATDDDPRPGRVGVDAG